jgi:S-adenosylmethionine hydrolase
MKIPGRDIFAPVIGHLMRGVNPNLFGPPAKSLQLLPALPSFHIEGRRALGIVLSADHFGNLMTNLPQGLFLSRQVARVSFKGHDLGGISRSYSQVQAGSLGAVWGSTGNLEIFQRNGSAAQHLGAHIGDEVVLDLA